MILFSTSAYFRELFDTASKEKEARIEIIVPGISGDILERVVDSCYQLPIDIDEENVFALLAAASSLQIPELEVQCIQYYKSIMRPSNCLGIWAIAEQFGMEIFKRSAEVFIFRNIKDVLKYEEFMQLSSAQLAVILKCNELNFDREEDVFDALIQWIRFDAGERRKHFEKLLKNVRLEHMEKSVRSFTVNKKVEFVISLLLVA